MKLLVFSFYFPPDLCAGSFRCGALVDALERRMPPGSSVDVVTTQPNRYKGAIGRAQPFEDRGRTRIHRIALPDHDSGMVDQSRSFAGFARQALGIARRTGPHDAVFATSSRLMTAALGAWHARRIGAPLYLDIRDLFVETMSNLLTGPLARPVYPLIGAVERATFAQASTINIVSPGFEGDIRRLAPQATIRQFTNGIDDEFLASPMHLGSPVEGREALVVYAGNIGEGQGLHEVLPDAARRLAGRARFRIIGQGGRLPQLREAIEGLDNVELVPAMPRARLLDEYSTADMLFLHLNDRPAFTKVLPSKLFEYGALGQPLLAGLSGISEDFVRRELPGSAVFAPCDATGMVAAFEAALAAGPADRSAFRVKYARATIMDAMAADLVEFTARAARK